jgi:hypothetical protein
MSGWGRDREMRPMIFGIKICRLDLLFLLHQGKRKESLKNKKRVMTLQAQLFISFEIIDSRSPINY